MSRKCILGCKGFKQLFAFPSNVDELRKWCEVLGLDPYMINIDDKLCERHFDPKFIGVKRLKINAFPERPTERSSTSKSIGGIIEVAPEKDTTGFETIYLTLDGAPPKRSYEKKSCSEKKAKIDEKTMGESAKINELIAARNPGFEPVKVAFESPPKRTYAHGISGKPKTPQLDITMTCYCRCHKGEEEERRELMLSVEAMKKQEEEQSREIQQLMSQNKISEHLLKTKTKRIAELVNIEESLRKEIEALNSRITEMGRRQIKVAAHASENSITFARMVCAKRKKYTVNEVLLAQKVYSISGRCYNFMRGVLLLNLPHTSTLMRQRQLKADNYVEHVVDLGSELEMLEMLEHEAVD